MVLLKQRQRHCVKEATAVSGDIQLGCRGCCGDDNAVVTTAISAEAVVVANFDRPGAVEVEVHEMAEVWHNFDHLKSVEVGG